MFWSILLALFNGTVIGLNRAINGSLSTRIGTLQASLFTHSTGFLFLTLIILFSEGKKNHFSLDFPFFYYGGGFFGATFLMVNGYVFPRLGAMKATLLVISGQMIAAIFLDFLLKSLIPTPTQLFGVFLVIAGISIQTNAPKT